MHNSGNPKGYESGQNTFFNKKYLSGFLYGGLHWDSQFNRDLPRYNDYPTKVVNLLNL